MLRPATPAVVPTVPDRASSQTPARFEFEMDPPLEYPVAVVSLRGEEALSECYEFEIEVTGEEAAFVIDERLDQRATFTVTHGPDVRRIHGVVKRIEHVSGAHQAVHTVFTLAPELWLLSQHQRCRIYQDQTVPEIVARVLANAGVYANRTLWRLSDGHAYARRTYCVQYRETDLQFVQRLLEEEGIFYFFDHPVDGPEVLVFCDSNLLEPIDEPAAVNYREDTGQTYDDEHVVSFALTAESRPRASALRDYDPMRPRQNLETTAHGTEGDSREIYDYPGGYTDRGDGRRRARNRLEALRGTSVLGRGEAVVTRMAPGRTFVLAGHPRSEFDQEYVLWRVRHRGRASETTSAEGSGRNGQGERYRYAVTFECTPAKIPVRIPTRTPKPRVYGSQTARVVGPAGEEIHTDEHGRIRVQFHWDRDGLSDEHSSCWVRTSQSWAGTGWGGSVIPRIGMEVVVAFLEGDPDQPLVTGCVYNGVNPPPNSLPGEKTKSTFKTNSSPGGNGFNELTFEDAAGSEKVFLRAQKDLEELVLHDHATTVGNDQSNTVGHDQANTVGNDQTERVGVDQSLQVGRDRTKTVGANESNTIGANQSLRVGANRDKTVSANEQNLIGANRTTAVVGSDHETVGGDQTVEVRGHHTLKTHAMRIEGITAGRTTSVSRFDTKLVKGVSAEQVLGPWTVSAMLSADLVVISSRFSLRPTSITAVAPKELTLKCGPSTVQMSPGKIVLTTGKGASIVLDGADVKIVGTNVKTSGDTVDVVGAKEVNLDGHPVSINCT